MKSNLIIPIFSLLLVANSAFSQITKYKNSQGEWKNKEELPANNLESDYSKPVYDEQGKLIKEIFWGCATEKCIKWIEYKYNEKNQLIEETFFYTGTTNLEDAAKHEWVNSYLYDYEGKLLKKQVKYHRHEEFASIVMFNYDKVNKLYGKSGAKPEIPYKHIMDVLTNELFSRRHDLKLK